MLYKNTQAKVHSAGGDTDFFELFAGILQGDPLASAYVLRTSKDLMKENGFTLENQKTDDTPYKLLRTRTTLMI